MELNYIWSCGASALIFFRYLSVYHSLKILKYERSSPHQMRRKDIVSRCNTIAKTWWTSCTPVSLTFACYIIRSSGTPCVTCVTCPHIKADRATRPSSCPPRPTASLLGNRLPEGDARNRSGKRPPTCVCVRERGGGGWLFWVCQRSAISTFLHLLRDIY